MMIYGRLKERQADIYSFEEIGRVGLVGIYSKQSLHHCVYFLKKCDVWSASNLNKVYLRDYDYSFFWGVIYLFIFLYIFFSADFY